jgi:hypothetical protein
LPFGGTNRLELWVYSLEEEGFHHFLGLMGNAKTNPDHKIKCRQKKLMMVMMKTHEEEEGYN